MTIAVLDEGSVGFIFFHSWDSGFVVCRDDTEADNAFLSDSGSQYNCVVGILFIRTTRPLFNQVLYCYYFREGHDQTVTKLST